jgi:hypothetical protein
VSFWADFSGVLSGRSNPAQNIQVRERALIAGRKALRYRVRGTRAPETWLSKEKNVLARRKALKCEREQASAAGKPPGTK